MNYMFNSDRYGLFGCDIKVRSLFINNIHKDTGKYVFPFHRHDDFLEISLILDGEDFVEFENEKYVARKGDIVFKNAGSMHQEIASDEYDLEEVSIGLSGIRIEGFRENCMVADDIIPVVHAGEQMELLYQLAKQIRKLSMESITTYSKTIDLLVMAFVSNVLLIVDENGSMKERKSKKKYSELVWNVRQYIDENYSKSISLDDIAKEFFVSPYSLARQFKNELGFSVNQYIQNRRLGRAEERLVFEATPIKEIAAECGYTNIKHFYSVFKVKTGHTPMEFRKMLRTDSNE